MAMVGLTWLEVSGQIVIGLSVMLGTVALLLLPGGLVTLLATRHADADELAEHEHSAAVTSRVDYRSNTRRALDRDASWFSY